MALPPPAGVEETTDVTDEAASQVATSRVPAHRFWLASRREVIAR